MSLPLHVIARSAATKQPRSCRLTSGPCAFPQEIASCFAPRNDIRASCSALLWFGVLGTGPSMLQAIRAAAGRHQRLEPGNTVLSTSLAVPISIPASLGSPDSVAKAKFRACFSVICRAEATSVGARARACVQQRDRGRFAASLLAMTCCTVWPVTATPPAAAGSSGSPRHCRRSSGQTACRDRGSG